MRVFTLGHSTRTQAEFLDVIAAHALELIVDVRRFPTSRRHPHFDREALTQALDTLGVGYGWFPGLGGRRSRRKDSPHTAWQVPAFAGYADHMETAEFLDAAAELLGVAATHRTAVLCAEARPEQCHRRLLSDWLTARGVEVDHIQSRSRVTRHQLPEFARIEGGRVIYDGGQMGLL